MSPVSTPRSLRCDIRCVSSSSQLESDGDGLRVQLKATALRSVTLRLLQLVLAKRLEPARPHPGLDSGVHLLRHEHAGEALGIARDDGPAAVLVVGVLE